MLGKLYQNWMYRWETALTTRDENRIVRPVSYAHCFAAHPKKVLVVYAKYDLTFLPEYSLEVVRGFSELGIDFISKVLPCGHYTTGETPYKYIDGWYLGSFVYSAFKGLVAEPSPAISGNGQQITVR